MGIILFLVDTSASMNQRSYLGTTYLDLAKLAIETFMKYRMRDPSSRGDRYMLVTFNTPNAVKSGWKENHATFVTAVKNLEAVGLSDFGHSLKESFDLLNIHRLHTSIDHYGQGRNPFFLEPAVVIALTDGGGTEIRIPPSSAEGSELTREVYRWDQRLFTILLRFPGLAGAGLEGQDSPTHSSLCEATGGKAYVVASHKSLMQSVESLTQKLHPGVVIQFCRNTVNHSVPMDIDGEPPRETTDWHSSRKMVFVKSNPKTNVPSGFWPLPEPFWTDLTSTSLPSRHAHPIVWFDTTDREPLLVENFPFDKYELEPSPLTQHILSRRKSNTCWQVFVENSSKEGGLVHPFGYLKASSSLTHVTLFVMPFNYPTLLPLIEELCRSRMRPTGKWRQEFSDYLATVPPYYATPLRNALRLVGAPANILSDSFDGQLSYSISNYLRKLKRQAKAESERIVSSVAVRSVTPTSQQSSVLFNFPRNSLLTQLRRLRGEYLSPPLSGRDEGERHCLPVGAMGNYQEHLKRINPLRELDSGAVRTQLFGNPFKLERATDNKRADDGLDVFADEHMVERRLARPRRTRLHSPRPPPVKTQDIDNSKPPNDIAKSAIPEEKLNDKLVGEAVVESENGELPHNKKRKRSPSPLPVSKKPTTFTSSALPKTTPPTLPPPKSSAAKVLTAELENSKLRNLIVKEVRKAGKNYDVIFSHLEGVAGSAQERGALVADIVKEATKFKKWKLIEQLKQWS